MVCVLFNDSLSNKFFSFIGKWDQVTGVNSPLYRSHMELDSHEDWKNAVRN